MLVNRFLLRDDPPTDAACNKKYCLATDDIPTPAIASVEPSKVLSTGGDIITLELTSFPAVERPDEIEIVVGGDADGLHAEVTSVTILDYLGLESTVQVSFAAPVAPAGPGLTAVEVSLKFRTQKAGFTFMIEYVRPISGPIQVLSSSPTSIFSGADNLNSEIRVEMNNVPALVGAVSEATTKSKLILEIRRAEGVVVFTSTASTIHEWTYDSTRAVLRYQARCLQAHTRFASGMRLQV